jgi:hypothetical protein
MGMALPVIGIIGTAVSVVSSLFQGQAQSQAAKAQAAGYRAQSQASEYNAQVARQNAQQIIEAGAVEEQKQRDKAKRLLGTQQALYGKSGVTNEGTPLEVMADTAAQQELDALTLRHNYWVQSQRQTSEAGQYDFMANRSMMMSDFSNKQAGYASTAGIMKAGTSLLTGLGQVGTGGFKIPTSTSNWDWPGYGTY